MPTRSVAETALVRRLLGLAVLLGVVGSLLAALISGSSATLPGVALGSPALLYVEKATACFTGYLLFLVVVVRASSGELPSELRGVRYESRHDPLAKSVEDDAVAGAELRERLRYLERVVDELRKEN